MLADSDAAAHGLLGGIAKMLAASAPADAPWDVTASGLIGGNARLQPEDKEAPPWLPGSLGGVASGSGNRPPSSLENLANSPWPPPSIDMGGFGRNSVVGNSMSGQLLPGYASFDAPSDLIPPPQNPQPANPATIPLFERNILTLGDSDQSMPPSVPQNLATPDLMTATNTSGNAAGYPTTPLDPLGLDRVQLAAGDREKIDPEEIFDPLAPVRIDLYNVARYNLRQIQPKNYTLSVSSLRTPGSAPTRAEIGELIHAHRVAQSTQPLADIASRIASLVKPFAQKFRTVSVLKTPTGTFIAGSGDVELEPDQRDAVGAAGATEVPVAGIHAEIAALDYAKSRGELPQFIGASRPFCPPCRTELESRGGLITSPTTAVFPGNIPSFAFPLR
jgi:hypothetical protein